MGELVGKIELTPLVTGDGRSWSVDEAFIYKSSTGIMVDVPSGFITDLASVPSVLWFIYPPEGLYTIPAIIHDAAYQMGLWPRPQCDELLKEAMADCGCSKFTQWVFYRMVRMFGGRYYKKMTGVTDATVKSS